MKYPLIFISFLLIFSCSESDEDFTNQRESMIETTPEELSAYVDQLVQLGFEEDEISYHSGTETFFVENDMAFSLSQLKKDSDKQRMIDCYGARSEGDPLDRGYAENYEIEVFLSTEAYVSNQPGLVPLAEIWRDAMRDAITQWNSLNSAIRFVPRTSSISSGFRGVAFFPETLGFQGPLASAIVGRNAVVGSNIWINIDHVDYANPNHPYSDKVFALAHELGHSIGYVHTDSNDGCHVDDPGSGRRPRPWSSPTRDSRSLMNTNPFTFNVPGGPGDLNAPIVFSNADLETHRKVYSQCRFRPPGSSSPYTLACNYRKFGQ